MVAEAVTGAPDVERLHTRAIDVQTKGVVDGDELVITGQKV